MRYKGYVATYVGETKKVNNDNFFLNGICKEHIDDLFVIEENKEFKSRNIYAVASGAKSKEIGDELAYIAVDILRNFYVADFDVVNREFFHVANTAITSQVLDRSDEHYEVDMSILSIDRDVATVYNIGDIPVFYYANGKLRNLAGKAPEEVELEKDFVDSSGLIKTQKYSVRTVPYLGTLSNDKEVIPYASQREKLRKKSYFVMCSRDVMRVLDENTIESVLADKKIKKKYKALSLLDKAIKKDSEGNYTVQVIAVNHGLAIAAKEVDSLIKWLVAAVLCICICFNGNFLLGHVSKFLDGCKSLIQSLIGDDGVDPTDEYRWDTEEANNGEIEEDKDVDDETDNVDEQLNNMGTEITVPQQPQPKEQVPAETEVSTDETEAPSVSEESQVAPVTVPAPKPAASSAPTAVTRGNSPSATTNSSSVQRKNTTSSGNSQKTAASSSKTTGNGSKNTKPSSNPQKTTASNSVITSTPQKSYDLSATVKAPTVSPSVEYTPTPTPVPAPAPTVTPSASVAPQDPPPVSQKPTPSQSSVSADSGISGVAQTGENELPLDN